MSFGAKLFRKNRAREFIAENYAGNPKAAHLLNVLPALAAALWEQAKTDANGITRNEPKTVNRHLLAECVLDFELVSAFGEVRRYTGDAELSSCYVDALLFEAIGSEASGFPSEAHYRTDGTHIFRGVAKYSKAKEYFNLSGPNSWLLAKEYSFIVSGFSSDPARIFPVLPLTVYTEAEALWRTRYALTGEVPTKGEQEAVVAIATKMQDGMRQLAEQWNNLHLP